MQRYFYATTDDLIPVFEAVEVKHSIVYTLTGLFDEDSQASFFNGAKLPSLPETFGVDSAIASPAYLVTERKSAVSKRLVQQISGGRKYAVDQLMNPDSVVVRHGGLYSPEVLISGGISTAYNTPVALKLHRAFATGIAKNFTRVKAYWVGRQALRLLHDGARLTDSLQSPKEFDLTLD